MKLKLLFALTFCTQILFGQSFTDVSTLVPFSDMTKGSIAVEDVDGDQYLDVLMTGVTSDGLKTGLYINDGTGSFVEVEKTPFDAVEEGDIAFADIDGDKDVDALITGKNSSVPIAKLYENDGTGIFTEVTGTPFDGVELSSIAFADIDGDKDQDVLISGKGLVEPITKLYRNNGRGSFTEVSVTPFDSVYYGSVTFTDVDGDNDQDVFITGVTSSWSRVAKLYKNNGNGVFTEVLGTPFEGVAGVFSVLDIDGDNDQDVLLSGVNGLFERVTKLYKNDGLGDFSLVGGTPFESLVFSDVAIADIDGDQDQDILILGNDSTGDPRANLYQNDGTGTFSKITKTALEGTYFSKAIFFDFDGDNDEDLIISGQNIDTELYTGLYQNDGTGTFSVIRKNVFRRVEFSSVDFADIDGDSDLDVLIIGDGRPDSLSAILYENDGNGNFSEVAGTPFIGVDRGDVAFADIDGDTDKDVLIAGRDSSGNLRTKLYRNDGQGNFSAIPGNAFLELLDGSVAFADVDGDKDLDVLITGRDNQRYEKTKLYKNNGLGTFTEVLNTSFEGVSGGPSSIAFADVDGDTDMDVLISGSNTAKLYMNNGTGYFSERWSASFVPVSASAIAFADVDGDMDQDLLITGYSDNEAVTKLYKNDSRGNFTEVINTNLKGVFSSSVIFADLDGDTDQDIILAGNGKWDWVTKLYQNDGMGNFSELLGTPFNGIQYGSIACADVDGDMDLDVLITGEITGGRTARLYRNDGLNTSIHPVISSNTSFLIYPNPASEGITNIRFHVEKAASFRIRILDINGRHIYYQQEKLSLGEQEISLDISHLPKGIYLLSLGNGERSSYQKLVIR